MTQEQSLILAQQKLIRRLEAKIQRLENRLLEKKVYEHGLLQFTGASPQHMAMIDEKDREALEG